MLTHKTMTLNFNIDYKTAYGEELVLYVRGTSTGGILLEHTCHLSTLDGLHWQCTITHWDGLQGTDVDYRYSVCNGDHVVRREWSALDHRIRLSAQAHTYTVYDVWEDMPEDAYRYTSAFTACIDRHAKGRTKPSRYDRTLRIVTRCPQLRSGQRLALTGDQKCLGEWNPGKAVNMKEQTTNEWFADFDADRCTTDTVEIKCLAVNDADGSTLWETGENHKIDIAGIAEGEVRIIHIGQVFFDICNERIAGTLIPVFSLRSETSFGVGDFGDLRKMIDWVADTHQRVLQVLPINDTTITHTWTDSYPYSCISIFALHPQYADLTRLPAIADEKKRKEMEELRLTLNALPQVDYERVNAAKTEYLHIIFEQEGHKAMRSPDYRLFFFESRHWLVPYAQYCYLRDAYGTADFSKWPDHQEWHETDRAALANPRTAAYKRLAFYYWTQYILCRQMEAVHSYAMSRGVVLKGDIPIGVNRHGCDVWHEPQYFNLNGQAGAPPDAFSVNGQNWGFPTYNWDRMMEDGCQWWIRRFQNMSRYFDAYRIDHVLGFFRIWEIPIDSVHGLLGQFAPALGMTRQEIEGYGLHFQEELFTRPFIATWVLERIFREHTAEVVETYLDHDHDDIYTLKPEYDTQRKIEAAFEGRTSEKDVWLRDGLYSLVSNVLFVRDRNCADKFHPRISAQLDFMYEALCDSDKAAFNRLYDDYFYRRNSYFWYREAMKKLPLLVQSTHMLVCAEDLGMVPECVPWVMNELRILSLEVQSMPKDPAERFAHTSHYPYRSVCTLSTHDMATLRQWWDEDEARTQDYFSSMLYRGGNAPHPLPGWLARDIISRQLASPSMLCVQSLQDWLAIDEHLRLPDADAERINIPANPRHYWRYRMHITIEELQANAAFNDTVKELIKQNGRA